MRTLSLVLAVALVVACKKAATPTEHNVAVKRTISEGGGPDKETWSMSVDSSSIAFNRFGGDGYLKFRGTDGKNAMSAFTTFASWAATAQANRVQRFSKRISSDCVFSTHRAHDLKPIEGPCEFTYSDSRATIYESISERDIAKFSELLTQLPEANAERLAKESKAEPP
jgi:hypothetical protein